MAHDPSTRPPCSIRLYESRGDTTILIDAEIAESGSLQVYGQDLGDAPRQFWGDSDYEYWVTIRPEYKDWVLLTLIEKLYGSNSSAVTEFQEFLRSKGIPCEFGSWV
jgi:hypothetical protein